MVGHFKMRSTVVIVAIFLACLETSKAGLKSGDDGVCVVKSFKRDQSHQRESKPKINLKCCVGWQYSLATHKCEFFCRRDCGAGKCVGPNKCSCDPPNAMINNKCVKPVCELACVNATCTGHNTCSCISNYEHLNDTHCILPCPTGFKRQVTIGTDPAQCEPICDPACINASCTGHNECSCIPGYEKVNDTHCVPPCPTGYKRQVITGTDPAQCEPICDPACINASCTGHNECSCIPGYVKINDTHCVPPCPTGYKRQVTTGRDLAQCEPICDPACINASCTGHNECSCIPGYEKVNDTNCVPPCPTGYKRHITVGTDPAQCKPICDPACVNATCTGYNDCSCLPGYKKINDTFCTLPCPIGFKRQKEFGSDLFLCEPICDAACVNATCSGHNICTCVPSYEKINDTHCAPPCPSGYKRGKTVGLDSEECVPKCNTDCVNAKCTGNNTCLCISGYEKLNDTHCVPPCPIGYKRLNTSPWQCDPICNNCQHGKCNSSFDCLCNEGYTMKDGKCVPECNSCTEGVCTAPGVCSSVLCKDCDGNCTDANVCSCSDKRPCFNPTGAESAEIPSSLRLAGLELTWLVGGVVGLVILTSLIVILSHMWKRRKEYGKPADSQGGAYTGSVVYTVSNTLLHNREDVRAVKEYDETDERDPNEVASESLLNNDDHERNNYKISL